MLQIDQHGGLVEHALCDWEVVGSIPGQVIPNTINMVLAKLSLGIQPGFKLAKKFREK